MKVGYNSTGYQMVEQWSSRKGTDSINISSGVNTDHGSILIQESEACLYENCTIMMGLIQKLIVDEMFSNDAEGIEEFSKSFSRNVDDTKYKFRSKYVPDKITMSTK